MMPGMQHRKQSPCSQLQTHLHFKGTIEDTGKCKAQKINIEAKPESRERVGSWGKGALLGGCQAARNHWNKGTCMGNVPGAARMGGQGWRRGQRGAGRWGRASEATERT